jgi:iron-only hydrogenase group A
MIRLHIDDREVTVPEGSSILEAARQAGVRIPTLCYLPGLSPSGACRICVVEVAGRSGLVPSCTFPAEEGMRVQTRSPRVLNARKTIIELLLASHPFDCLTCQRNRSCELQSLAAEHNVERIPYRGARRHHYTDFSSPSIIRDPDKCILCGRCVRVCEEVQGVSAIDFTGRGFDTVVLPAFGRELSDTQCVSCGQCVLACPTGALREVSEIEKVIQALGEGSRLMVAEVAPAIRVSLGEFYGLPPGVDVTARVPGAVRALGFQHVFDADFTADLAVMEGATELIERLRSGGPLPMFTSCCPSWVKFAEQRFPELLPNLSSCRSPQAMMGSLVKSYLAEKWRRPPEEIFVVSVMPCTAKKYEAGRPELARAGAREVDAVLTTRELARLLERFGIDFAGLPGGEFDYILGSTTGSGDIFAASGGVMESTLRTARYLFTGQETERVELEEVRAPSGFAGAGLKEATFELGGLELKVAVVNTLAAAERLVRRILAGEVEYHFVEVMACPGGCAGGGGQALGSDQERVQQRRGSLYTLDKTRRVRQSYLNERVQALYRQYLGSPGSPRARELLHTRRGPRPER